MGLKYVKFKKQLSKASDMNSKYTLIVGEEEIKNNKFSLKNMKSGEQIKIGLKEILKEIKL
jgi:histidyl-tRNA synthetase